MATRLFHGAGKQVPALELNLARGIIAALLLALCLPFTLKHSAWPSTGALTALVLSGIIGIGVGDTAFFRALNVLGTRRSLLLALMAAPVAAGISWLFLGENLSPLAWLGLATTLGGLALVINCEVDAGEADKAPAPAGASRTQAPGYRAAVGWVLLAAAGQGTGVVLARRAFRDEALDPALVALLRLLAGLAWVSLFWRRSGGVSVLFHSREAALWGRVLTASLIGTWLGMWLQQAALARIPAGLAQTLLSTAPLFALGLSRLAGRRTTAPALFGALLAMGGVTLLTLY